MSVDAQEYSITTFYQLFYFLMAVATFGCGIWIAVALNPKMGYWVLLFPLVFTTVSALIVINILRRKITIDDEQITCVSLFSTKQIALKGIKGVRVTSRDIGLEANSPAGAKIFIGNYADLTNSDELLRWAQDNFKDLDAIDLASDKARVLEDPNLGSSESERTRLLQHQKNLAIAYNIIGPVAGISLIFLPLFSVTIIGLLIPLTGVLLMAFSKGTIKFAAEPKRGVSAFIFLGIAMTCYIPLFMSLDAYTVVSSGPLWLPVLAIAGVLFFLLYIFGLNRSIGGIKAQIVFMAIISLVYGLGEVRLANYVFDRSTPRHFTAIVQNHWRDYRHNDYYLNLTPWGPIHDFKDLQVSRATYNSVGIDDTVTVNENGGWLHVPSFTISKR